MLLCLDSEWFVLRVSVNSQSGSRNLTRAAGLRSCTRPFDRLPKGVSVRHRGIVRLVIDSSYVKLDEQEVLFQYAPLSFDAGDVRDLGKSDSTVAGWR
jgi:hypothetical protein